MADSKPSSDDKRLPGALSVTVNQQGAAAVVTVQGDIDLDTSGDLAAALAGLDAPGGVDVDLSAVTYMDSTGLRVLLSARDAAVETGATLRVSAASSIVARLIEITGASELIEN
jgi:anti-anti-sigma factor